MSAESASTNEPMENYGYPDVEDVQFDTDLHDEQERTWRNGRIARALTRFAFVGAVYAGATTLAASEAAAADPTCYGDYCSGKYADDTNCDEDARTIAEAVVMRAGVEADIEVKGVSIGFGNDAPNEVARLKLRASDRCGTVWGWVNVKSGKSVDYNGLNAVGAQQDGGYTQERDIAGMWTGSPPAISFGPMIYGRGRSYRAYVEAGVNFINSKNGTYWVDGPK